jgi:hypothetical protein
MFEFDFSLEKYFGAFGERCSVIGNEELMLG